MGDLEQMKPGMIFVRGRNPLIGLLKIFLGPRRFWMATRMPRSAFSNPAMVFLRALCLAAERDGRLAESYTASNLAELAESHGISIPGLRGGGDERAVAKQICVQLGRIFREKGDETAQVDNYRVRRVERAMDREDGNGIRILKAYEIERA